MAGQRPEGTFLVPWAWLGVQDREQHGHEAPCLLVSVLLFTFPRPGTIL